MTSRTKGGWRAGYSFQQVTRHLGLSERQVAQAQANYAKRFGAPGEEGYDTAYRGWRAGYGLAAELGDRLTLGGTRALRPTCLATGCSRAVQTDRVACGVHWAALPGVLRTALGDALRDGDRDLRSRLQDEAVAYWQETALSTAVKG